MWWLSFIDEERPAGSQHLGSVCVRAKSMIEAIEAAQVLGLNPGGRVAGAEVPEGHEPPDRYMERLLSRAEIKALDHETENSNAH